jgi:nucleoside 2-deoxyribosyltransferase
MKVYIAGTLSSKKDREFLEIIDSLCKKYKLKTFLPHRDVGLWEDVGNVKTVAKKDIDAFKDCKLLIASLNGFYPGAGTAFEMGYAYAKKIPIIAIKTDRKVKDSIEEISAVIVGSIKIVTSLKDLEREIKKLI